MPSHRAARLHAYDDTAPDVVGPCSTHIPGSLGGSRRQRPAPARSPLDGPMETPRPARFSIVPASMRANRLRMAWSRRPATHRAPLGPRMVCRPGWAQAHRLRRARPDDGVSRVVRNWRHPPNPADPVADSAQSSTALDAPIQIRVPPPSVTSSRPLRWPIPQTPARNCPRTRPPTGPGNPPGRLDRGPPRHSGKRRRYRAHPQPQPRTPAR